MNPSDRNRWIDGLRALSALAVVLFHFNCALVTVPQDWLAGSWHMIWMRGYWGVGVFFALSGYCLFPGWNRAAGCFDFLRRRFVRIFPPYWASLLLIAGLALAARLITGVNDMAALPREPQTIAATLLLLTDPLTAIPTINWVYWTLTCLLACYLLMGLVLLCPRSTRIPVLAGLHVLLCLIAAGWPPIATGPLFFVQHWPVFGCGLALAVYEQGRLAGGIMLLTSLLSAVWLIGHGGDKPHLLAVGGATVALLALCRNRIFPERLRPLAWIGEISYSLYLVHVPIGVYGLMRFLPQQFTLSVSHIASQLVLLAATVAVAWLFYLLAERPFLPPAPSPASA